MVHGSTLHTRDMKLERRLNSSAEQLKSMHHKHKYKPVLPSVPVPLAFVVVPEPPYKNLETPLIN